MVFDINAIREKLKGLEEGKGKTKSRRWKPKAKHIVRCLPLPGEEDISFQIIWHYGVDGGRQIACPSTWGDSCAFCNLGKQLKSWKDSKGRDKPEHVRKMDWEFFKKIEPAVKHYTPVIIRSEDSNEIQGPFLWEYTPKTYLTLLKILGNDDWNDDHPEGGALKVLTSLTHGLDLVIQLKKAGQDGNKTSYDLTEVEERKKFSPTLKADQGGEAAARSLLTKIPNESELTRRISSEEIDKVFRVWQESLQDDKDSKETNEISYNDEKPASGGSNVDETVARLEAMLKR